MSTAGVPMDAASWSGGKKNVQEHQESPISVTALSIDINHQQSLSYSADSKARKNRRRRKGKARGNQVEPVDTSSSSPRPRNQYNNNKKKKNTYTNGNFRTNNDTSGDQQQPSSFRTPIETWRGSRGSRNNSNRYNNSNNNNKNNISSNNHNRYGNNNWNHASSRFHKSATSPVCPASTGYPTSKKQHDAPMKKRDLYFSLHVERVGIASNPSKSENAQKEGSEPDLQTQQQQEQEQKAVARVTLTNWENEFVLDTFVAIPVPVSDFYDTKIRPENVEAAGAPSSNTTVAYDSQDASAASDGSPSSFAAIRAKVERILRGKILIGYALNEGLQALGLSHPNTDMRDCSAYFSKNGANTSAGGDTNPSSLTSSLEEWSQKELNRPFQSAKAKIAKDSPYNNGVLILENDPSASRRPVQICVTTMDLYKKHRSEWETALIAQARERERQQQEFLLKLSQQRQHEQQQAQMKAQQQAQQQARQQHIQQQQYRESVTTVSLHCEMVRTALSGRTKTLARVTLVDGPSRNVLLDEFAQIPVPVTDYCDTGITDKDFMVGNSSNGNDNNVDTPAFKNPTPLSVLRGQVERMLRGRLLVGYKVEESLKALGVTHPWVQVRDVAYFPPFLHNKVVGGMTSVVTVRSLDGLSREFLRQQLRPLGDRSRPIDLCHAALGLYESFRGQWEQQSQSQQQDVFNHQHNQQQQVHHPHHLQGRIIPPSAIMQSPQLRHNHYVGQQTRTATYSNPMMMTPPSQQPLQRQVLTPEQQQQYSDVQSRTNSNSSSWFPWGKQQAQQQSNAVGTSQTLSPQAFQVLQEDCFEQGSSSPKNHFCPVSPHSGGSAFADRISSYDGSAYGGGSEFSEVFTDSVISSMHDESSSIISGDQASGNPTEPMCASSPSPSTWFRFGSKKSKDQTQDNTNSNCETMAAVQETEVVSDDGMLPPPTKLFQPLEDFGDDATRLPQQKTTHTEGKEGDAQLDSSSNSPMMPRSWFGFRKSPVQRDRSRSPSTSYSGSTIEDLSIAAQPEGLATETSIEITLSIPACAESDDTISPLIEKPTTTSLSSRPSSSWFGRLRSSKSSGSKSSDNNANSFVKDPVQTELLCHPDITMAPTECTTAMDEDWLQEIMCQSKGGTTQEFEQWMNGPGETKSGEMMEKQMSASRGQASWFGFKRSKAASSNKISGLVTLLDTTKEAPNEDGTWGGAAATDGYWLPEANALAPSNIEHNNNNNIDGTFHTRARLSTESTIPSVTTDEPSEGEQSQSDSYSNDLDFGAAQSFSFLKI